MSKRDPAFDEYVLKIHNVLDRLDYYRLLGVSHDCDNLHIKKAFYSIAAKFHPDRHRDAPAEIEKAIYDIFKRLNEAYRVLCDPDKKKLYNAGLDNGHIRFRTDIRMSMVPKKPEETITSKDAREFYLKAVNYLENNNILQADLHIKMANTKEPENQAILELIKKLEEKKKGR
jgi:curved DNA-binding protein CbpA